MAKRVLDFYAQGLGNSIFGSWSGTNPQHGQSFKSAFSVPLTSVKFYCKKVGSPTGNVYAKLYAHTGTFGDTATPTGSVLATSNAVDISTLSTSLAWVEFTFSTPYTLTAGTAYFLCSEYSGGDGSNYFGKSRDDIDHWHWGNACFGSEGSWTWDGYDGHMLLYSTDAAVHREAVDFYNSAPAFGTGYTVENGACGQTFMGNGCYAVSAMLPLSKQWLSGNFTISIYAHTGTFGTSGLPTGSALATVTVHTDSIAQSSDYPDWYEAIFDVPYLLTNGTPYVLVLECTAGGGGYGVRWWGDESTSYHWGNSCSKVGAGSWGYSSGYDRSFYVFTSSIDFRVVAPSTLYLSDTNYTTNIESLLSTSPASLEEAQGWTVNKKSGSNYAVYKPDTTRPSGDFGAEPSAWSGYGYRSLHTYTGKFANSAWTLSFKVKCNAYYAQKGVVKFKIYKTKDPSCSSGLTELTSGWVASTTIGFTATNQYQTGTAAWSPGGTISLDLDFVVMEIEWQASTSGGNTAAEVKWVHNEGTAEQIALPTFTPNNKFFCITPAWGGLTSAGSVLVSKWMKRISGSITPAGSKSHKVFKKLDGALTPAGVVTKIVKRALAGALSFVGNLSASKIAGQLKQACDGILNFAGTLGFKTKKAVAGTLTSVGLPTMKTKVAGLAGSITPAGAKTHKALKTLAGAFTPGGSLGLKTKKALSGALTSAGSLTNKIKKLVDGGLTTAGTVTKKTIRTVAGTLTSAGSLGLKTLKSLGGTLSSAGTVGFKTFKKLARTLVTAGDLVAQRLTGLTKITLDGVLSLAGTVTRKTKTGLFGILSPVGGISAKTLKKVAGSLTSAGTVGLKTLKQVSGTLTSAGAVTTKWFKVVVLGGTLTFIGNVGNKTKKSLTGVLSFAGNLDIWSTVATSVADYINRWRRRKRR